MKTIKNKTENFAIPGKPMSQKKFSSIIKQAEEGNFMTLEEFKTRFDQWRIERKNS